MSPLRKATRPSKTAWSASDPIALGPRKILKHVKILSCGQIEIETIERNLCSALRQLYEVKLKNKTILTSTTLAFDPHDDVYVFKILSKYSIAFLSNLQVSTFRRFVCSYAVLKKYSQTFQLYTYQTTKHCRTHTGNKIGEVHADATSFHEVFILYYVILLLCDMLIFYPHYYVIYLLQF